MICLTFDTDHVDETRMVEFLETTDLPGTATFFCTQRYSCLEGTQHELCPHPTLEPKSNWEESLAESRQLFPDALGWRSHSCVFSHKLAEQLAADGFVYASTHEDFGRDGLVPHRHAWGLWHLPIYYMDTLDLFGRRFWGEGTPAPFSTELIHRATRGAALYVFDFHPIHVLLNSPSPEFYLARRDAFTAGEPLSEIRFEGAGVGVFFDQLLSAMMKAGLSSAAGIEMIDRFR